MLASGNTLTRTLPPPRPTYGTWTRCQSSHVDAHAAAAQAHLLGNRELKCQRPRAGVRERVDAHAAAAQAHLLGNRELKCQRPRAGVREHVDAHAAAAHAHLWYMDKVSEPAR